MESAHYRSSGRCVTMFAAPRANRIIGCVVSVVDGDTLTTTANLLP